MSTAASLRVVPPARQGPGRLPAAVVARFEHRLRRRSAGLLPGDHLTPGAGDGLELAQLRPYEAGDDVRRLDPAASARTGVPHVRLQVPERAVTTWLALDVSASMAFGTQGRLKSDIGEGVAEVVGRVGTRRGGRIGLVVAGGAEPRLLPPRPGRAALASLRALVREGVDPDAVVEGAGRRARRGAAALRARGEANSAAPGRHVAAAAAHGGGFALADALTRVARVAGSTGVVVVVSDFRDTGWSAPLRRVAVRHSVLAVEVVDPVEAELPDAGLLTLVDPESGRLVDADTSAPQLRRAYAEAEAARRAEVSGRVRAAGADHLVLSTDGDWLRDLGRRMR